MGTFYDTPSEIRYILSLDIPDQISNWDLTDNSGPSTRLELTIQTKFSSWSKHTESNT